MGNQRFGRKRMKRRLEQNPSDQNHLQRREDKSPSPDDSAEENSEIASEEEMEAQKKEEEEVMDYKEPTMYDSLLESLRFLKFKSSTISILEQRSRELVTPW